MARQDRQGFPQRVFAMTIPISRPPIAFVSRLDANSEAGWLRRLADVLPEEAIRSFRDMSAEEKKQASIAVVANPDPVDISELTGLRWIHSLWAGVERLLAELPQSAPPIVRLVDPELSRVMAEAALAWTYYLHRDMPIYARQQRESVWKQQDYRHPSDRKIGLLGAGELGIAAARMLKQAAFSVTGWSRSEKQSADLTILHGEHGLTSLLAGSDIIICLLPITSETRGLLDKRRFLSMKAGASLINFARGPIVDVEALISSLDSGHISHAILDVFDQEPLDSGSPLWRHPQITVLPHISAPTNPETATRIVAENIAAYRQSGIVPPIVDRKRGY